MSGFGQGEAAEEFNSDQIRRFLAEFTNYGVHAALFTHDDGLTVSMTTVNTPVVSTGWNNGLATGAPYTVLNAANGTITIGDKGGGIYIGFISSSFDSDDNNVEIHGQMSINGTKYQPLSFRRSISNVNDIGDATKLFPMVVRPGDVIDYRWQSDTDPTTVNIEHGGFGIFWIGGV